jgi:hypothetical protein
MRGPEALNFLASGLYQFFLSGFPEPSTLSVPPFPFSDDAHEPQDGLGGSVKEPGKFRE